MELNNPKIFLDAISGNLVDRMLKIIPIGSKYLVFGNLSLERASVDCQKLIFSNSSVEGFHLGEHLKLKPSLDFAKETITQIKNEYKTSKLN